MKAYNNRLNHTAEISMIDFKAKKVKLVQPNSNPTFIYSESLDNVTILTPTNFFIDGEEIYEGDKVISSKGDRFIVQKVPGGFLPFVMPLKETFKRAT